MTLILLRQDHHVCRNAPIYIQLRIIPCNRTFGFRGIIIITLILEYSFFRENAEAVCKALGDEHLTVIVF